ncbi:hypothetical protein BDN70DRAFT_886246 [Pholiota conissans]|uniref:Uncharacterized protein n=1 Tax=Pholiota conissans TaxID=109636 RepID=A0A9P5YQ43_9AGAR|nr:hypothetical protein BDN70DRAFT_886246 [Pholiota conissans]
MIPTTNGPSKTVYLGAIIGIIFIATISVISRIVFVRRMRRRALFPVVTPVNPPYSRNSNAYDYSTQQSPYVPPPAPAYPYPTQRSYNTPSYPDYSSPYSPPYAPNDMSFPPPTNPVPPPKPSSPRQNPRPPPSDQDGRATSRLSSQPTVPRPSTQPTDGRASVRPNNNTTSTDGLGPPPAYILDGRDS